MCPYRVENLVTMNELVIKAQNIDEDIKGMALLEQIKYAADLYQEMTQVSGEAMGVCFPDLG